MAIPKSLKSISADKALALVNKHSNAGTGEWEGSPMYSDFIYGKSPKFTLLRPPFYGKGDWETGQVSL